MEYRCIKCGFGIKTLFVQYSPGNIRLMKCDNCKAIADEYIECEFMIIFIDLILHRPKAYRHLLYNVLFQENVSFEGMVWKSAICFLLLDAYKSLLLERDSTQWGSSLSFSSFGWICSKVFMNVFVANFLFLCIFLLAMRTLLHTTIELSRCRELLLAILVSSYFKVFLMAMMVWEFPSLVIFIIDLFVLSSNIVAIKVTSESAMDRCMGACLCAHAVKLLATMVPQLWSLGY
ncbi:hypothetical protein K2173_005110 [Erythroxylum novogranatense]|uniref:Protein ARV n=1 Tax=Erythroxylum novogranatense TaxID=1862640 RepID=A0AAV8U8G8_9ROSI|nr:hypothetical protein K2173_005110 [Erythroxylum novogranatense]